MINTVREQYCATFKEIEQHGEVAGYPIPGLTTDSSKQKAAKVFALVTPVIAALACLYVASMCLKTIVFVVTVLTLASVAGLCFDSTERKTTTVVFGFLDALLDKVKGLENLYTEHCSSSLELITKKEAAALEAFCPWKDGAVDVEYEES